MTTMQKIAEIEHEVRLRVFFSLFFSFVVASRSHRLFCSCSFTVLALPPCQASMARFLLQRLLLSPEPRLGGAERV